MSIYLLQRDSRELYNQIYDAISAHKTKTIVSPVSDDLILPVYSKVLSENPEGLMYKVGSIQIIKSWKTMTLLFTRHIEEHKADSVLSISSEKRRIIEYAHTGMDNYGSILSVYRYFVENYSYSDNDSDAYHQTISPLLYKKAVCEGFSILFAEIMNTLNIPCGVISGTGNRNGSMEPHSWNIVKYNNRFYHLDVTWDICTKTQGLFFDYFMVDDSQIRKDHSWDDMSIPKCFDSSMDFYAKRKLLCRSKRDTVIFLVNQILIGNTTIGFRIKSDFDRIKLTDSFVNEIIDETFRICKKSYSKISYRFNDTAQTVMLFINY